jgi:spore coat polysaccharide biosynthesis protein SpsF
MKFDAIIEARMNSSRLPGKILKKINGLSFIELLIKRLSLTKSIDNIYVATTINKKDDKFIKVLKKNKIKYYRGSENNVLERVIKTCKKFKSKNIVMITGDCPFIDYNLVEQCIQTYKTNNVDIVGNALIRSFPDGMDTQVLSYKILKDSFKRAFNKKHFEHSTLFIRNNPNIYKILNIFAPPNYFWPDLGLTLDEEKDLILLKKIYKKLNKISKNFTCLDVINFLKKNKNLLKINKKVKRTKVKISN